MMARSCRSVRRQLSAFHDGELPVGDRIAVQAHLQRMPACAPEVREFDAARLRGAGRLAPWPARRTTCWRACARAWSSRVKAEREQSIPGGASGAFEDLHVFWAALGATGATVACLAIIFGIFFYATQFRPDSLGGQHRPVVAPGGLQREARCNSDSRDPAADGEMGRVCGGGTSERGRHGLRVCRSADARGHDRLTSTCSTPRRRAETFVAGRKSRPSLAQLSKARFEPARYGGASGPPVAVNMVWLHAQLTVRAKLLPDEPRPAVRSISSLALTDTLAT